MLLYSAVNATGAGVLAQGKVTAQPRAGAVIARPTPTANTLKSKPLQSRKHRSHRPLYRNVTVCAALSREEVEQKLGQVEGWTLKEGGPGAPLTLARCYKTRNFMAALDLCRAIGDAAESAKHHPDLHIESWNTLRIELSTHDEGGLTEKDFELAAEIDTVPKEAMLSKKKQPH